MYGAVQSGLTSLSYLHERLTHRLCSATRVSRGTHRSGKGTRVAKLEIVIADDHPVVRSGLRYMIDAQPDMRVVGEAADGAVALEKVLDLAPQVALVDVALPLLSGAELTERVRIQRPTVKVLALSA